MDDYKVDIIFFPERILCLCSPVSLVKYVINMITYSKNIKIYTEVAYDTK